MANIINAANAFAAGFSGGVSTYAQLDSLWAAQDERKRAEEDRAKLDKAMQDTAAYLEQSQDPTGGLSTPEGQQALGQLAMGNPEVAKAVNSNPGYSYAGVVKDPKQEDAYHIVVRGQNDEVRPVTVGREKGGTPVTYTGADLQSFSLTPFLDPKNDTPERRALMKLPQDGDVFDALATKFPGMTGAQLRAQAEAGAAKLSAGAIPTAKQGVAGVKATVRDGLRKDSQPGVIEEEEEESSPASVFAPTGGFSSTFAAAPKSTPKKAEAPTDFRSTLAADAMRAEKARMDALVGGEKQRQDSAAEAQSGVDRYMEQLRAGGRIPGSTDSWNYGDGSLLQTKKPAPETVSQPTQQPTRTLTPAQQAADAAAAARSAKQTVPAAKQSVAQKVVASQRLPSKVMANPQHLAAVGQEIGSKIQSMPRGERVNADAEALDRLTKLGKGTKPNRAALYSAMYLVKSGVLTPAQLGQFASTGKLDNVEFDNAYKEISARQSYHQLDLNERQFAFSQFKEQMEQQRHVDNLNARYSLEAIRQNNALTKEQQKAEIKRVEGVQKNGREMLENAAYLRFKQANPQATEGEAKAGAIVLANQILGDEAGVYQMLGGRLPMFDRDYQKLLPVVEKMAPVKTQGGWSWTGYKDPTSLPLRGIDTDFSIGRLMATDPQGYQPKN